MNTYHIIGGAVSPCAIVVAKTPEKAKQFYNDWLQLTYGRTDEGVGIAKQEPGEVAIIHGGFTVYAPGVKGHQDDRYHAVDG